MLSLLLLAFSPAAIAPAERAAVFVAAGAKKRGKRWVICSDEASASAQIDTVQDLNGDGRPEAIVSEEGTFCHGMAGTGFVLVGKQADGKWKSFYADNGMPIILKTKGVGGWPDISVGGPGFCFPVMRWNGKAYAYHHSEYEGRRCRAQ